MAQTQRAACFQDSYQKMNIVIMHGYTIIEVKRFLVKSGDLLVLVQDRQMLIIVVSLNTTPVKSLFVGLLLTLKSADFLVLPAGFAVCGFFLSAPTDDIFEYKSFQIQT